MNQSVPGICPSCDATGPVAVACAERACQKLGHRFIPVEHMRRAAGARGGMDPVVGQVIGDYLVVGVLGVGGFGKVYLALQLPILRLQAALKLVSVGGHDAHVVEVMLEKFLAEANALAALNHPNIVRLLKYGLHQGMPYLVMELVASARTLKAEIHDKATQGQRLEIAVARHVLRQLLNGLEAAHELGIVHRDMKPENVMLQRVAGDANFVRILDFGLAKFVGSNHETSMTMGTPLYMAPEQLMRGRLGPWTDLYAQGVMTFELMTGRRPFAGRTHQEIFASKLDPHFDATSRIADLAAPDYVLAFLRKALARDPELRFRSAPEMRAAMEQMFDRLGERPIGLGAPVDVAPLLSEPPPPGEAPTVFETGRSKSEDWLPAGPTRNLGRTELPEAASPRGRRRFLWGLAGGAACAAIVSVAAAGSGESEAPPSGTSRASVATIERSAATVTSEAPPAVERPPSVPPVAPPTTTAPPPLAPVERPPAPALLRVTVASTPSGATVLRAGAKVGTTPYAISWSANEEAPSLSLRRAGYRDASVTLVAHDDGTTRVVPLVAASKKPRPTEFEFIK